jgi:signal transduction histidine kinase
VAEELRIAQPSHNVEIKIDKNLRVQGDGNMLRIALRKLLDNAWKYTASQLHPKIQFLIEKGYPSMTFSLRDNGEGFAPQYASKLFGEFASLPRGKEFPGVGLGLATVKRIIQRHSGRVWAQSELNQGAVFYFTIPTVKASGVAPFC